MQQDKMLGKLKKKISGKKISIGFEMGTKVNAVHKNIRQGHRV